MGDLSPSGGRLPRLFRQPKIQQLRACLRQHDVARLQISVDDTLSMGLVEGRGDFNGNPQKLLSGQRALLQPLRQRLSFQVLHHQKIKSLLSANVMERADIRMIQIRDGPGFPLKAFPQDPLAPTGVAERTLMATVRFSRVSLAL